MILFFLLVIMLFAFPEFRRNWLLSYRWIEQESDSDILGKMVAVLAATFIAPVMTIFNSIKKQLNNTTTVTQSTQSEPSPQDRYNTFAAWFDSILIADWENDERLKEFISGRNWIDNHLIVHFHNRPKHQELSELKERFKSYGLMAGWEFQDLGELYLHNFEISSKWSTTVIFVDKISKNYEVRLAELARVKREKVSEIPQLSLFNYDRERFRKQTGGKFPLWVNPKGQYQFIELNSHVLVTGATGSGKTMALTYWLWLIDTLKKEKDKVYILDYKRGRDWAPFHGNTSKYYTSGEETKHLWAQIYQQFKTYQNGAEDIGNKVIFILIDELASLVESYPNKKERDEFLRQFKDMLRLSRNLGTGQGGYRIIVGLQQADSTYFGGTEGRGNLGIRVALGGVTTEGVRMIFEITDESDKPESSPVGKGFAQIYGEPVRRIMIPYIKDRELVLNDIAKRYSN